MNPAEHQFHLDLAHLLWSAQAEIESEIADASIYALKLDVQDVATVSKLPDSLPEEFQQIDILVNNAGCELILFIYAA